MNIIVKNIVLNYKVRNSFKEKTKFLDYTTNYFENILYKTKVDETNLFLFKNRNLIIGDLENASYVFTAHYDTPRTCFYPVVLYINSVMFTFIVQVIPLFLIVLTFSYFINNVIISFLLIYFGMLCFKNKSNLNDNTSGVIALFRIADSLPDDLRDKVAFVFFDNEESGLVGSFIFKRKYKKIYDLDNKLFINFDCIGLGEDILFLSNKNSLEDANDIVMTEINNYGKNLIAKRNKNFFFMSDHNNFKKSICVASFKKDRFDNLYLNNIHNRFDNKLDLENIEIIKTFVICYILKQELIKLN